MNRVVPGAAFTNAVQGYEFANQVYKINGHTATGRRVQLVISASGSLLAVNTETTLQDVPRIVIKRLDRWLPGFQTQTVSTSVRAGGARIWYRFEGRNKNGRPTAVEIRADARKVLIEE
jgi:hypothetical protein